MVSHPSDLGSPSARNVEHAIGGLCIESREQLAAAVQTQSILDQLQIVLASLDSNLRSLLKITVYLRDMSDFPFVRNVLLSSLGSDPPAISVLAVSDLPLPEARLQIEAVAI
jgi:enamine deaminase RidA (YjgF/YER057c/UK114 family)